jgi:hypothetical protein
MVLMALGFSILLIFPILFAIIMFLPLIVYVKKLVPNYKKRIVRSDLYRKVTGTKTAEEIEQEIIQRRKEQINNVVITDNDFAQFIYVNRAANKWKSKLKKNREPQEELKDILDEGTIQENNIHVNESYELDCLKHRQREQEKKNGDFVHSDTDREPLIANGDFTNVQATVVHNGKFVTDV